MVLKWFLLFVTLIGAGYAYLRWVWFFRDPIRLPPQDSDTILAPVDGKVVYVRPIEEGTVWSRKLGKSIPLPEITRAPNPPRHGWMVGIYMSPLDTHYVYAPAAGKIAEAFHHSAARNWPMVDMWEYVQLTWLRRAVDLLGKRHHLENERLTMRLSTAGLDLWLVEIADRFVNKIRRFVEPGQEVVAGQKLSFISRGSQVDLLIPDTRVVIVAQPGMQVYGALTVIARRGERP